MIEQTSIPQRTYSMRPILLLLNTALGIILWFGLCSDYSWDNVWGNFIFSPVVGLVGLVSVFIGRKSLTHQKKRVQSLLCLLSIIGGIPYLTLMILAIVPPFLLATMFWFDEQSSATRIQRVESPSGSQIAEVYFLPVGAYSGGNGRIEVHLKYKWLPFVKRDIFYLRVTHEDENTTNYLSWLDDKTLYIPEKDFKLNVNWIEWEMPSIISLPIGLVRLFLRQP
jgi:predicted membrane protein